MTRQLLVVAILALLFVREAIGATFTTINYPDSTGTIVTGISGNNVVGYSGDNITPGHAHSFLYDISAGTYSRIDGPSGATDAIAFSVSGNNVYGYYYEPNSVYRRLFLYDGSSYTDIHYPGAVLTDYRGYSDSISGINVVGHYDLGDGKGRHGFVSDGSTYTTVDPPGGYNVTPVSISGNNVVGRFQSGGGKGFLYDMSTEQFVTIAHPDAGPLTQMIAVSGSTALGEFVDTSRYKYGFLYNDGNFTTLPDPPDAMPDDPDGPFHTQYMAISEDNVVGHYLGTDGVQHGFLHDGSSFTTIDGPGHAKTVAVDVCGNSVAGFYYVEGGPDGSRHYGFVYQHPTDVPLDIKPDDEENAVNLKAGGVLPVAILTTDEVDALTVDVGTLLFGDPLLIGDTSTAVPPIRTSEEDVNADGLLDLGLFYSIPELVERGFLGPLSEEGSLTGALLDGTEIIGSDTILVVPRPEGDALQGAGVLALVSSVNISLVPEPSSIVLLSVGGLGMLCWRRRRRRA